MSGQLGETPRHLNAREVVDFREKVTVRPARPQDADMIQAYMRGLSPASRQNRFLGALNEVSASELYGMTHNDHGRYPALIAETVSEGARTMIGEARYAAMPDGFTCEFAVSVAEAWRRKSLGMVLIEIVTSQAMALGAQHLVGDVFRSNRAMITLARKTGFEVTEPVADARLVKITKHLCRRGRRSPSSDLPEQWASPPSSPQSSKAPHPKCGPRPCNRTRWEAAGA
jgi:acetyltransferase